MREYPDRPPATIENRPFPFSDICEPRKIEMIDTWLSDVEQYSFDRLVNYIQFKARPTDLDASAVSDNHQAAEELCDRWDKAHGQGRHLAMTGFTLTRAFTNDTRLLPSFDIDLTHELDEIRRLQADRARGYAMAAWTCMSVCHPVVFEQHQKLIDLALRRFAVRSEEDYEYFLAGVVLPYTLASTTRLLHHTSHNTQLFT